MKLSVSLSEADVELIDEHARSVGLRSRSAVLHVAIGLLRRTELEQDYAEAWADWEASDSPQLWETTVGDGLTA